jgi:hypothetical protein
MSNSIGWTPVRLATFVAARWTVITTARCRHA